MPLPGASFPMGFFFGKLKHKIGGAFAALALVAGAVPGAVTSASAIETGQMIDRGRFPRTTAHFALLGLGLAALIATIVLVSGGDDNPTSP